MIPVDVYARGLRAAGLGYQAIADACGVVLSTAWKWTSSVAVSTAAEHDRRRRPPSEEHRRKLSVSVRVAKRRPTTPAQIEQVRVRLANLGAGLGIAGALCAAYAAGTAGAWGWYPGCSIAEVAS